MNDFDNKSISRFTLWLLGRVKCRVEKIVRDTIVVTTKNSRCRTFRARHKYIFPSLWTSACNYARSHIQEVAETPRCTFRLILPRQRRTFGNKLANFTVSDYVHVPVTVALPSWKAGLSGDSSARRNGQREIRLLKATWNFSRCYDAKFARDTFVTRTKLIWIRIIFSPFWYFNIPSTVYTFEAKKKISQVSTLYANYFELNCVQEMSYIFSFAFFYSLSSRLCCRCIKKLQHKINRETISQRISPENRIFQKSLTDCRVWRDSACPPWAPPCRKPRPPRSRDVGCRSDQSRHRPICRRISWTAGSAAAVAAAGRPCGSATSSSSARSPSLPPGSSETEPPVPSHYNAHWTQHAHYPYWAVRPPPLSLSLSTRQACHHHYAGYITQKSDDLPRGRSGTNVCRRKLRRSRGPMFMASDIVLSTWNDSMLPHTGSVAKV